MSNDIETLMRENVTLRQQLEAAEKKVEELNHLITEHDGIECTKHDVLVMATTSEARRLREALNAILAEEQFEMAQWSRDTRLKIIQAQAAAARPDCARPFRVGNMCPTCVAAGAESEEK